LRPLLRQSGFWAGFVERRGSLFGDCMAGVVMMKLIVSQLGEGAGISLSDSEMEVLGLQIGDALEVTQQPDGSLVLRTCYLDQIELAEKIMSEDRDILSKLS
jgi:antitoxin component of MazEF toxin-antitoxin module